MLKRYLYGIFLLSALIAHHAALADNDNAAASGTYSNSGGHSVSGRDIYGNPSGKNVQGNPHDLNAQGNRPKDIEGNPPHDIYGNKTGTENK